jgi:YegS/Rv2252/BmrU family lipid kinase
MIWFIVNRTSGNGKGAVRWAEAERILKDANAVYGVRYTEFRGHATQLATELAARGDTISVVAIGGDGTVNEVACGLAGGVIPMGCIPSGSGNDYARSVGIPKDVKGALRRILEGKTRTIDAARLNGRGFIISSGIGFDGEVARVTNEAFYKRWLNRMRLGSLSYVITVLRLLVSYKTSAVTIQIDDKTFSYPSVWLIAIANMPYYGGGMKICPDAKFDDGQFQLCIVDGITRLELLMFFPRVFQGTHISHPAVHLLTGSQLSIRSERPLSIHADGEWAGTTPAVIDWVPEGLNIL